MLKSTRELTETAESGDNFLGGSDTTPQNIEHVV